MHLDLRCSFFEQTRSKSVWSDTLSVEIRNFDFGSHFGLGTKTPPAILDWSFQRILLLWNTKQSRTISYNTQTNMWQKYWSNIKDVRLPESVHTKMAAMTSSSLNFQKMKKNQLQMSERVCVWIFTEIGPAVWPVELTHTSTHTLIHTHTHTHTYRHPRLDSNIFNEWIQKAKLEKELTGPPRRDARQNVGWGGVWKDLDTDFSPPRITLE